MMRKVFKSFILIILPALTFCVEAHCAEKYRDVPVRVCIADGKALLSLAVKGSYRIYEVDSDRVLMQSPYLSTLVTATKDGIKVGAKDLRVRGITISPIKDSDIYIDNRRFRGKVDILIMESPKMTVINYVPMEEYLYGVLYHEVSHKWPMEALKAQAIAARTFALYQVRQNKNQPYDLRNDVYSQVYGGKTSEKWATTKAVDLTRGEVLAYKADIFPAYFHATCAGSTEDSTNLWTTDIPPLDGVVCEFCKSSPHYGWTKEMPLWVLADKLKDDRHKVGDISSVRIISKNRSGRVDKVEIKDDAGSLLIMSGKDFRQMLGPNEIRSARFDLSQKWDNLIFNGSGWGHGVGMCQWGAYGMSLRRKKAADILKHYYPGAEITTIDKLVTKP